MKGKKRRHDLYKQMSMGKVRATNTNKRERGLNAKNNNCILFPIHRYIPTLLCGMFLCKTQLEHHLEHSLAPISYIFMLVEGIFGLKITWRYIMSSRSISLSDTVVQYLQDHSITDSDILRDLRAETALLTYGRMQISPEQGQFMNLLVELTGAQKAIEVGTFTGYSALLVAQALPSDGILVACDISEEWTNIAKKYWERAKLSDRIDLRIGPALDTLASLSDQKNTFDFGFIDADKVNYMSYYESILGLLRPGGLLLIDNVLWGGSVADPEDQEESTVAIRTLNTFVHQDPRVSMCMIPIGDGLTLVRKR